MKQIVIDGQIGLFDIPTEMPKENIKWKQIVNKYRNVCTRIVDIGTLLLVELEDKTISFDKEGNKEHIYDIDINIRPKDKILISNIDKDINEIQIKKYKILKVDKFIKRKSDKNLIIPIENFCMVIYPSGNIQKWNHVPVYNPDEIFKKENIQELLKTKLHISEEKKSNTEEFKIGDTVKFEYSGEQCTGKVVHIYNNGESVNVEWDNKRTSFYYKCLNKIS